MLKNLSIFILFIFSCFLAHGQEYTQYFDEEMSSYTFKVEIDTTGGNQWQIGSPQKSVFSNAATAPNVLITDTINTYAPNDTSQCAFGLRPMSGWGVVAVRWKQKVCMDYARDGGVVEFTLDSGATWQNVFNNPYVYAFYGYDTANVDTLPSGEIGFTGIDTTWRDVWLCFDNSFLHSYDSISFRFTFISDSADSLMDGWMIDNLMIKNTWLHGAVHGVAGGESIKVFPTHTSGIVHIQAQQAQQYHIAEYVAVTDLSGRIVRQYKNVPTRFFIDITDQPPGMYYVTIRTNLYFGSYPVYLVK